jgi:hypothetical protein
MALPATALAEAVTITVCAVPGVKLSVAGCAVTPLGSPAIATFTVAVNPFAGTAFKLICCPPPPGTSETLAGKTVRLKSATGGGAETPTATAAEWLRPPDVPANVTMALAAAELAEALTVIVCAVPGVKLSEAGCAVTPLGSPAIATFTMPVNPLAGTAFTLICCPPPPGASETLAGVAVRLKSPGGGAGVEPPPQETSRSRPKKLIPRAALSAQALISKPRAEPRPSSTGFYVQPGLGCSS